MRARALEKTVHAQAFVHSRAPAAARRAVQVRAAEEEEFDQEMLMLETEEKMGKSIESLKLNLMSLRTGRASPDILARVMVEYYGAMRGRRRVVSFTQHHHPRKKRETCVCVCVCEACVACARKIHAL